jgi:hypothetical protein
MMVVETPLAQLIGVEINLNFSKGQETALVKVAMACEGSVLIAWLHESIPVDRELHSWDERRPHTSGLRTGLMWSSSLR